METKGKLKPYRVYLLGAFEKQSQRVFVWAHSEIAAMIKVRRKNRGTVVKISRVEAII